MTPLRAPNLDPIPRVVKATAEKQIQCLPTLAITPARKKDNCSALRYTQWATVQATSLILETIVIRQSRKSIRNKG